MAGVRLALPVVVLAAAAAACTGAPPSTHERLAKLVEAALEQRSAGRQDEAVATVRRMAELAPDHPWPYELAVRLHAQPPKYEEAEALMRGLGSTGPGLAFGLAWLKYYQRDYGAALEGLEAALGRYEAMHHTAGEAFSQRAIGQCYFRTKRLDEAETRVEVARRLFLQIHDESSVADTLNLLAAIQRGRGREHYARAIELHREALAIWERTEDQRGLAETWYAMGFTLREAGDEKGALDAFGRSVAIHTRRGDQRDLYRSVQQVAATYLTFGRQEQAAEAQLEAATLAESTGMGDSGIDHRRGAGWSLSRTGQHEKAIAVLQGARLSALALHDDTRLAQVEGDLGWALLRSGAFAAAADKLREAAELANRSQMPLVEANAFNDLGKALHASGRLADALIAEQRALDLYRQLDKPELMLISLNNLAATRQRLGDMGAVERYLQEGLELVSTQALKNPENREVRDRRAQVLSSLGEVAAAGGRKQEGLALQQEALRIWESLEDVLNASYARVKLAEVQWSLNEHEEALRLIDLALEKFREAKDAEGAAETLNSKSMLLIEDGRGAEAQALCNEALNLARSHSLPQAEQIAHVQLARIHEEAGRLEEASAEYRRALEGIESQRAELPTDELKMRFLAPSAEVYERAVSLEARLEAREAPSRPRAFALAERARARALAELLAESAATLRQTIPAELVEREQRLADRVSAAAVQLAERSPGGDAETALVQAEEEFANFKIELRRRAPGYSQVVYPDSVDLAQVQQRLLADDETLLRYFVGASRTWLWVVDRREARAYELPLGRDEIARAVGGFLSTARNLDAGLGGHLEDAAERLGAALLAAPLPAGRRLLVVPDGPLARLPFEALRRDGRFLIEDHEVAVVPSATVLRLLRDRPGPHADRGFLGLGDPVSAAGSSFPELPYTGRALGHIARLFPAQERVLLTGAAFTKEALRRQPLDTFRFIHFATHAWSDPEAPRRVGLRLSATADGTPEFLYLDDVFLMHLDAELVVLSACQSGLGELLPGEGMAGLTRAFLQAGARSVLVSLWNVGDRPTGEFMDAFYRELDGRTIPEALRRAKLSFLASERPALRQPYSWAPFVLVGDPGSAAVRLNPSLRTANNNGGGEN